MKRQLEETGDRQKRQQRNRIHSDVHTKTIDLMMNASKLLYFTPPSPPHSSPPEYQHLQIDRTDNYHQKPFW